MKISGILVFEVEFNVTDLECENIDECFEKVIDSWFEGSSELTGEILNEFESDYEDYEDYEGDRE